jgi:dTDP-4-dehydrorhamnose 3,5-epimerase-like enzyme
MYKIINFKIHGDHNGSLVAVEGGLDIPFEIKRVYYIWGTAKNTIRGGHSHFDLSQVIVAIRGSCDFSLDNGKSKTQVCLNSPSQGIFIKKNIWREFTNFSRDCVLMVLASHHYDESDYIRNYDEFLDQSKIV